MPFLAALVILIVIILLSCINVVPQARAYVIERLGGYQGTWGVGIHFKIPFIDRVARKVDLKEQVADFPPQPVITKDNVTMRIDTVIFYQITDRSLAPISFLGLATTSEYAPLSLTIAFLTASSTFPVFSLSLAIR